MTRTKPFPGFFSMRAGVHVRVYRQLGTPVDLGGWCVDLDHRHLARFTSRRHARTYAAALRRLLKGLRP